MKKNNRELTQAEKIVHQWTGHYPNEMGLKRDIARDPKDGFKARHILAKDALYAANPELAFGIARRLLTHNVMKNRDFAWFMANHPAWSQIWGNLDSINAELMDEINNSTEFKTDRKGKTRTIQSTIESSGEVEITYMSRKGVKTEKITLGFEMAKWAEDTRPFIALNLGGGSAIRHFLLKKGDKPDYKINDDSQSRRYVDKGKGGAGVKPGNPGDGGNSSLAQVVSDGDLMARLMAGETLSFFDGAEVIDEPAQEAHAKKESRKISPRRA